MEDPPKRKRKLIIVDVPGDGIQPMSVPAPVPVVSAAPLVIVAGPGPVHARVQQEVLAMARKARFDEDKIEAGTWARVDSILDAPTREKAEEVAKVVLGHLQIHFLLLTKHPEKQAKAAERIAKMWRTKGEDEKADKQLEKAKKIREEMAQEKQSSEP